MTSDQRANENNHNSPSRLSNANHPDTDTPSEQQGQPSHPIASAITAFLSDVQDIEDSARNFVPDAIRSISEGVDNCKDELNESLRLLQDEQNQQAQIIGIQRVYKASRRAEHLARSRAPDILQSCLFLGLFSAYETFTGNLLTAVYSKKPEMFANIGQPVPVAQILRYQSFDELRTDILRREVEDFRRKGYTEQFEALEKTFSLDLKNFERWPDFVERTQRRHLITHNDGIVTEQYLTACRKAKYTPASSVNVGDKLGLGAHYFLPSCSLIAEVALRVGQTVWRKLFPDELEEADEHLQEVIYSLLLEEKWKRAQVFGLLAFERKRVSSDVMYKMDLINYVIALKFGGEPEKAKKTLSTVDWTAAANDFKLAEAVLLDKYEDAATIMLKIGERGELVAGPAYHGWPLFHEFRQTKQFLDAYETIYGHPFVTDLQRNTGIVQSENDTQGTHATQVDQTSSDDTAEVERLSETEETQANSDTNESAGASGQA